MQGPLSCLTQLTLLFAVLFQFIPASAQVRTPEQQAAANMEQARAGGPLALRAFLVGMPKGGDLHNHLVGAVYAETWLRDAAADHVCIDPQTLSFAHRGTALATEPCAAGNVAASTLQQNQPLYDKLVDSFSMRSFVPVTGESGHDHFFSAFDRFLGLAESHKPEWVDEIAERAAAQNEEYLELMDTPDAAFAVIAQSKPVPPGTGYAAWRQQLLEAGLGQQALAIRQQMDRFEQARRQQERCDTAQPALACTVEVRYLYQVLHDMPPSAVFAQIVLGFEVAAADLASPHPHYVGLNLVQPEDAQYSMADYALHMHMIAALRQFYPRVPVTLHAGEIAPGLVPPEDLRFHIHQAVEIAGAQRIGHGVDVMYEDQPYELLKTMADRHVMVEVNLTSNDIILGMKGQDHPLPLYRKYGVPVALSTDDEGVSRIDLTHEYVVAAETFGLTYSDLKEMARNSIEYSFLPGPSLWSNHDYRHPQPICAASMGSSGGGPDPACGALLDASPKARQQLQLEQRFRRFESAQQPDFH
ncbi:MAG TPA: adenosine deaminase [Acidobacteriaceae bacterium]|nr:adenosine deaminase [Acidobacteriaceae bacterium]